MKKLLKVLGFLITAFAGGFIAVVFIGLFSPRAVSAPDALSIANTYIVFTSFIFVGFTVVLGLAGYVFTQQFTSHRMAQESQAIEDLTERLKSDDALAIKLLSVMLENREVQDKLDTSLRAKVAEVLTARRSDAHATRGETERELAAIRAAMDHVQSPEQHRPQDGGGAPNGTGTYRWNRPHNSPGRNQ